MTANRINGHSVATAATFDPNTKLPISDIQAEMSYIGSALYDARILDEAPLPPDVFYLEYHRQIVRLMLAMHQAGEPIDVLTLSAQLVPLGESLSGSEWDGILTRCIDAVPHPGHAAFHARTIRERYIRRTACYAVNSLHQALYETPDVQAVISSHIDGLERLIESGEIDTATDCATGLIDLLEAWKRPDAQGIPTGYPDIDALIGGFQSQRLYLLAAKTAIGKTALAINFAAHVARTVPVLFVSLEMSASEVFSRFASSLLRKSTDSMRGTVYAEQDTAELTESFNAIARLKVKVDDRGGRTIASIAAQARKLHRKRELGFLIVDYVGLVSPPDPKVARYEQLGAISRGLKLIAKNLGIPVLALSQLSRQADGDGVRPQLYHLRESGNLEQDSDVVLLIHRERHKTEAELLVEKNRSGKCGTVNLIWHPEFVRYDSAATTWQNAEQYDPMGGES